jgi:hypothetical protein
MSYRAHCPVISQHQAEEFGKWLALYRIEISGLQVWQIDAAGKAHRDDAMMKTIKDTIGEAGLAVALAPVVIPIVGMCPPLAAVLAAAQAVNVPTLLGLKRVEHALNKRLPDAGGQTPIATELVFGVANETDKHRGWTEYLLGAYAQLHGWDQLDGAQYPKRVTEGRNYAAKTGRYPPPWSQQPRGDRKPRKPKRARAGSRLRDFIDEL